MAEKELADGEIGKEGMYDLKLADGVLCFMIGMDTKGVDASFEVKMDAGYFIDKLKAVIPGEIDDAVLEMLKVALKGAS
jgi:hypothetical protein